MIDRRAMLVALLWATAAGGCAAPPRLRDAALPAAASDAKARDGYETVIRVDQEGNVYRGGGPPVKGLPREAQRAGRDAPSAQPGSENSPYAEFAAALQQGVTPQRIEQLVAAHQRQPEEASAEPQPTAKPPAAKTPVPCQLQPPVRAASGSESPALPAGVTPTLVHSLRFPLEYDDQALGPDGITKVELYGTRDCGRTWHRLGEDADRKSPYLVEMPGEGVFGFRIAVAGRNGLASRPPKSGDLPELWVRVDLSQPLFAGNLRAGSEAQRASAQQEDGRAGVTSLPRPDGGDEREDRGEGVMLPFPQGEGRGEGVPVQPAAHVVDAAATAADWQAHLQQAIRELERELAADGGARSPEEELGRSLKRVLGQGDAGGGASASVGDQAAPSDVQERARLDAQLRLLYLAAGRHEDAIRASRHQSDDENEFWSHQMHGLKLLTTPSQMPAARRASAALVELRDAQERLGRLGELQVKNLTFCTSAQSFGVYSTTVEDGPWKHKDYSQRRFEPQQPVVLYFEVSNFASQQHASREYADGAWRTSLRASYTVVDAEGQPVEQRELKLHDDICRNRRSDYFVAYKTWIPKLSPGRYSLDLLVEDAIARKVGTASIDFEVVAR